MADERRNARRSPPQAISTGKARKARRPPASTAADIKALETQFLDPDQDVSSMALAQLIQKGKAALPVLIEALSNQRPRTRRLAVEGLSEIGDPACAEALYQATRDENDEVRARAATALHRLDDPRALTALINTLDDYPDELHQPYTASMYPLMRADKSALPLVAPLLLAANADTREHAFLVLQAVVRRHFPTLDWEELWHSLGDYAPNGEQAERKAAARLWQAWVAAHI